VRSTADLDVRLRQHSVTAVHF